MVKWSEPAKEDLKAIYEYIAHDSPFYAQNVINQILDISENLNDFKEIGRVVPELNDSNIREIFIYSYRIIFENIQDSTIILAVIHGRRNFSSTFQGE